MFNPQTADWIKFCKNSLLDPTVPAPSTNDEGAAIKIWTDFYERAEEAGMNSSKVSGGGVMRDRTIIQITAHQDGEFCSDRVIALADDGTIWVGYKDHLRGFGWHELPGLPPKLEEPADEMAGVEDGAWEPGGKAFNTPPEPKKVCRWWRNPYGAYSTDCAMWRARGVPRAGVPYDTHCDLCGGRIVVEKV